MSNSNKEDCCFLIVPAIFLAGVAGIFFTIIYYEQGNLSVLGTIISKILSFQRTFGVFTAFLSGFAGAAGGAWIIHSYERRQQKRQDDIALNRSLGILASIVTTLINIKRDYSEPQIKEYEELCDAWNTGQINKKTIELSAHQVLSQMGVPAFPRESLHNTLMQSSKSGPNTFLIIEQLNGTLSRLESTIKSINTKIEKIEQDKKPAREKIPVYLGLVEVDGKIDGLLESLIYLMHHEINTCLCLALKAEKVIVEAGSGKRKQPTTVREMTILDEAKQYLPPDDYVKNYDSLEQPSLRGMQ